ncbi:MAG: hypothetical protein Aurels2KO_50720 [Aureliella sp.]
MSNAATTKMVTMDLERALDAVAGDRELLAELAVIFDEDLGGYITAFESKLEAGDAEAVYRVLHKLKGGTAPFFAEPVSEQLIRLMAATCGGDLATASSESSELIANLNGLRATLVGRSLLASS